MSPEPPPVTRTAAAFSAAAAGRVARGRLAQPNGWWGMVLFLCAEATVFGTLIGTYFYLDFDAPHWPPPGVKPPDVTLPLVMTAVLVATSVPMWLAARAARAGRQKHVLTILLLAALVQIGYIAVQVLLFRHDLNDFTPQGSAYGSIYFTLLAAHHAHVVFGILLNLVIAAFVGLRGLTNYWLIAARSAAVYWYVVNALAVLVVLTQLSPSL